VCVCVCVCFHAPEHFVQFVGRHATAIVHKTEAQLFSERHNIYPDVLGCDARVRCIICRFFKSFEKKMCGCIIIIFSLVMQFDIKINFLFFLLNCKRLRKLQNFKYNL